MIVWRTSGPTNARREAQKAHTTRTVQAFEFWMRRQGRYSSRCLETDSPFNGNSAGKCGACFMFPRDLFMRASRHDRFSKCASNDAHCDCHFGFARVRLDGRGASWIDSRIGPRIGRRAGTLGPVSGGGALIRHVPGPYRTSPRLLGASIELDRPASRRSDVQQHQ